MCEHRVPKWHLPCREWRKHLCSEVEAPASIGRAPVPQLSASDRFPGAFADCRGEAGGAVGAGACLAVGAVCAGA